MSTLVQRSAVASMAPVRVLMPAQAGMNASASTTTTNESTKNENEPDDDESPEATKTTTKTTTTTITTVATPLPNTGGSPAKPDAAKVNTTTTIVVEKINSTASDGSDRDALLYGDGGEGTVLIQSPAGASRSLAHLTALYLLCRVCVCRSAAERRCDRRHHTRRYGSARCARVPRIQVCPETPATAARWVGQSSRCCASRDAPYDERVRCALVQSERHEQQRYQ